VLALLVLVLMLLLLLLLLLLLVLLLLLLLVVEWSFPCFLLAPLPCRACNPNASYQFLL
jgi:hypothetical protein